MSAGWNQPYRLYRFKGKHQQGYSDLQQVFYIVRHIAAPGECVRDLYFEIF